MIKTLFVNGCSWTEGHMLHLDSEVNKLVSEEVYEGQVRLISKYFIDFEVAS